MKRQPIAATGPGLMSRDFMLLWSVGGIGNFMRWLEGLAAALFTLDVTGSPLAVAVVTASRSLPLIATGALAGVIADALDRRAIVAGGLLVSALAAAAMALLARAGVLAPWHLVVAGLANGLVYGTDMPARRRMLGESVEPALTGRAIALDSLTASLSRGAGPLAGGAAYQILGVAGVFAVTAALSLLAAWLALRVRHAQPYRTLSPAAVAADLLEAVAVVRRMPVLIALMAATLGQNLFGFAYTALMAPVGRDVFGASAALIGVLAAAEPAGAGLGGAALALGFGPPGRPVWLLVGGSVWFLIALALTATAPWFWACALLLFLGGFGIAVYSNEQSTIALGEAPAAVRSRVMGLATTAIGGWPLGMLLAGWLADRVGPLSAMAALGAGGLAWQAAVAAGPGRRAAIARPGTPAPP